MSLLDDLRAGPGDVVPELSDADLERALRVALGLDVAPQVSAVAASPVQPHLAAVAEALDRGARLSGARLRVAVLQQERADPDRLRWPEWWWDGPTSADYDACQKLWRHGLAACIRAALEEGLKLRGRGRDAALSDRLPWIGTADYLEVADLAGWDRGFAQSVAARLQAVAGNAPEIRRLIGSVTDNKGQGKATDAGA